MEEAAEKGPEVQALPSTDRIDKEEVVEAAGRVVPSEEQVEQNVQAVAQEMNMNYDDEHTKNLEA